MEQHQPTVQSEPLPSTPVLQSNVTDAPAEVRSTILSQERNSNSVMTENQEAIDALLVSLKRQNSLHKVFGFVAGLAIALFALTIIPGVAGSIALYGHDVKFVIDFGLTRFGVFTEVGNGPRVVTLSPMWSLLLLAGSSPFLMLIKRRQSELTKQLSNYEDVRAVVPLIGALYTSDRASQFRIAKALIHLLPRLTANDAPLLGAEQRLLLSLFLGRNNWSLLRQDDELSLTIIHAYSQIGDGSELPVVRRLADGKGGTAARNPRVREAAQRYLDEVERKKERETMPRELMRASGEPNAMPEVLLRPVEASSATDPNQLLRSSDCDKPDGSGL